MTTDTADEVFSMIDIGDYVVFRRKYSSEDFSMFSKISGDYSPIHHDKRYASQSEYGDCIVPLYLYSAPVSAVAGMYFPGDRALIVKSTVNGVSPLRYGQEITYSTTVVSKTAVNKVLSLRSIGFCENEIVLDVETLVQIRSTPKIDNQITEQDGKIRKLQEDNWLLIFGATSRIGEAIAIKAAEQGKNLVLCYYSDKEKVEQIAREVRKFGVEVKIKAQERILSQSNRQLQREAWYQGLDSVVFVNSSPLSSDLAELIDSNYSQLKKVTESMLPTFLEKQRGRILNVGSSIVVRHTPGYENYMAAKAASASYIRSINHRYSKYGVEACTLAPDIVATNFSENMDLPGVEKLLPEEVADKTLQQLVGSERWGEDCIWMTPNKLVPGTFGFSTASAEASPTTISSSNRQYHVNQAIERQDSSGYHNSTGDESLFLFRSTVNIAAKVLGTDPGTINAESGIATTPGWNSLKQIEIIYEIERQLGVRYSTDQMENLESVQDLVDAIK